MVARVRKVARYIETQTGMVPKVARVARYRDRYTNMYGCKGCEVHRLVDRQVWFQRMQGTETGRRTGMVAMIAKVARYSDRQTGMVAKVASVAR